MMKYRDLIQFDPIEEIIKFGNLSNKDYRIKIVKTFVCSEAYEKYIIPRICDHLHLNSTKETKGIQIIGNYGTGKSHLMSLFTIIAEDASYLEMLHSEEAKKHLREIAGKYKVFRFELGNNQDLWSVVTYKIDTALKEWGVDFRLSDDNSSATYSDKLQKMLAAFEEKYPDKGFMLVVDEMLSYLKGRSTPDKLNSDLQVLQALGQMSDRTRFRMAFGVQEKIYQATEFQFAKDMLGHVSDRYLDLTIQREDVQYIVQQRLLQKNEHQREAIRNHLSQFTEMFPVIRNNMDKFVNLFPVHPSYFDNFSLIKVCKSQREVLKTLSRKFDSIKDDDVPDDAPGLVCYDSYWKDMLQNPDIKADPDVSRVSDITALVDQKIDDYFTQGLAPKRPLAHRIVSAAAIKMLQADLTKANGVSPEALASDFCHIDKTVDKFDYLVDLVFKVVLNNIVKATIGQYFEKGDHGEYHLRIEGGVNYEQQVSDYAANMSLKQKDFYFYSFLAEVLPVAGASYRTGFNIWSLHIKWRSHNCHRAGYIFMGHPNERSTTQPQQHFYIYFMPIFEKNVAHDNNADSVYFLLDNLSEEFRQAVSLYGSALAREKSSSSDEKPYYKSLREKYFKQSRDVFNKEFIDTANVEYIGEKHPMRTLPGVDADSKIDAVSGVTACILEQQFEHENPLYPKFDHLSAPLTADNRAGMVTWALEKVVNPDRIIRNGEAILMALGLWEDGNLSTLHSQYARSLKQKLDDKDGKVLNQKEIIEPFYAERNEWVSCDCHIEADLEMVVMAVMSALGEAEIVLADSTRINATTITKLKGLKSQDFYTFSHICPPKEVKIPLIREIMRGLLNVDRTSELDTKGTSVYADLVNAEKDMEKRVVSLQQKLKEGLMLGNAVIISKDKGAETNRHLDSLRGLCNQLQNYNTKAKMRNIPWKLEDVHEIMTQKVKLLKEQEEMLGEMSNFRGIISYLSQAMSNVAEQGLHNDIQEAINRVADVVKLGKDERRKYNDELEFLRKRYVDYYIKEYLKAHISPFEQSKKEKMMGKDQKAVCDVVRGANFINSSRYDKWIEDAERLKPSDPAVTREAIANMPTATDGFRPVVNDNPLPEISSLESKLEDIYNDYVEQFQEALDDPTASRNREMLTEEEKSLIDKFKSELKLDSLNAKPLIDAITKLQHSFVRIEICRDELSRIFSRPMKKGDALTAFSNYVEEKSRGKKPEDVRIIIK